ncbi:hypothetical protein PSAC2689_180047 [Paraburkholderia sacchari]
MAVAVHSSAPAPMGFGMRFNLGGARRSRNYTLGLAKPLQAHAGVANTIVQWRCAPPSA